MESAEENDTSVSQMDKDNISPQKESSGPSWSENQNYDSVDELILNEAVALAKLIKSEMNNMSEDTSDGGEETKTNMSINSHPDSHGNVNMNDGESEETESEVCQQIICAHEDINTSVMEEEQLASLDSDSGKTVNIKEIPITSPLRNNAGTFMANDRIGTTAECYMIMTQFVPLVSSGLYVVGCGSAEHQMIHAKDRPFQDETCSGMQADETVAHCSQVYLSQNDKTQAYASSSDTSLDQSLPIKHDSTLDEEFFSCEESFTAQDMTLKDIETMTNLECQTDESDERTLSLASSDSEEVANEGGKRTLTSVIDFSGKMPISDNHEVNGEMSCLKEAGVNIVKMECSEFESVKQNENDTDQDITDRILDDELPSTKVVHSSCPGDVLVQAAVDLSKKSCGSLCESLMTDDQDSVTDAGYQASESSGQEDTGYEEGETDGMNAMIWNHQITRHHVQAAADSGNRSADVYQPCSTSKHLSDKNSGLAAGDLQEFDSTVKSSEEIESKRTDKTDSSETMQLVSAESMVILKPRISGSEFSETLSYISISRGMSEKRLELDSVDNEVKKIYPVSLFVELAEAEQGPCNVKHCIQSTGQEDFNDTVESDIDDAEALMAKSRLSVIANQANIDQIPNENKVSCSEENEEKEINQKELSPLDLAGSNASEVCVTMSTNNVQTLSNQEKATDLASEIGSLQAVGIDIGHNHDNHPLKRTADDLVSDVTSGHSTPRSGSQSSSSPSDELLQLLDKITVSGSGMRAQLEMAYARQAFIHEVGSRVDQIRSNMIRDLQQELGMLKAENQKLIDKVTSYRNNNKQNTQKIEQLEALISQLQIHPDEVQVNITQQKFKEQERTANMKDIAVSTDAISVSSAATQTWCSSHPESEVEFGKGLNKDVDLQFEMRTSTPSQMYWSALSPRYEVPSPTIIQGSVEFESDKPPKRMPSMVSLMIDKILHQMNNLADVSLNNSLNNSFCKNDNSLSSQQEEYADQEGPDRWRQLAVAPISTDPNILILQRSLAAASFENELLRAKAKNSDDALSQQVQHLASELEEYKIRLMKANEELEVMEVKFSGDKVEMELLRDQIASLEKSLSKTQAENNNLKVQLDKLSAEPLTDANKSKELELKLLQLLEENAELQKKLENMNTVKKELEQDLDSKVEKNDENQSSEQELVTVEQPSRNCSPQEVVITHEEYNHLQSAMNFLQKYLDEYSEKNVTNDTIAESGLLDKQRETQQDNTIKSSKASKIVKDSGVVNDKTSDEGDELGTSEVRGSDTCVFVQNAEDSTVSNMSFPIYKADIEELKTHVFGWRRLYGKNSLSHSNGIPSVLEPNTAQLRGENLLIDKLPGTPITDGFSMMKGTISKYGNLNSSAHHVIPLSTNIVSSGPGGSTLHDDIMKQSEMVLDIIKESGDIKEADIPPAVFHWQDVRNSIAHQLLNESHQKIETLPQCESLITNPKEKKDAKLTSLLKELEGYLKEKDSNENINDGISKNAGEDTKSKLPDSIRILKKAVEQELGTSVNITIQTCDDQPAKISLNCSMSEGSNIGSDKNIEDEHLEERKDINKRKEKYKEEFDRINAEYEELRRKRLSLLVQAYTGKQDPRPLSTKANSTITDTAETSKALAFAKASIFKSRPADDVVVTPDRISNIARKAMESKRPSAEYLASQTRVQRDLFVMAQKENSLNTNDLDSSRYSVLPGQSMDLYSASGSLRLPLMSKPNALLSSRDNRTISAISQDSQLIKERIQAVREQLSKAEQKHDKSVDYASRYYDYVGELEDDEPVDDEYDEYSTFQSPTKLPAAVRNQNTYEEKQLPLASLTSRTRRLRREIYPHKKSYEPSSVFWQRCHEEKKDSFRLQGNLNDTGGEEVHPPTYVSECASSRSLGQTLDDLEHEDYLKYPENRGNITSESADCIDDRIDPNICSTSTKERLNRSVRELHDYYQGHDQSYSIQEHPMLDMKPDVRSENIPDTKEPSTVLNPDEQLNRWRKCPNSSNSNLDQTFYLQPGTRNNNTSLNLPVDPCSFFKNKNSPDSVKKNEKDAESRRKPLMDQERSHYSGHIENASYQERRIYPKRANSVHLYERQNYLKSKCAGDIQSSSSHDLNPEMNCPRLNDTHRQVSNEKDSVPASSDKYQTYKYVDNELSVDRSADGYYALGNLVNDNKTERKLLNDSVHMLDDCNCVDMNTSIQSVQGQREDTVSSETATSSTSRMEDKAKYGQYYKRTESWNGTNHSYDQTSCIHEDEQCIAPAEQIAQNIPQSEIPGSSQMDKCGTATKRSEDDESVSTSDAELVVTKSGDILKRPRSTSPTHNVLLPREPNLESKQSPDDTTSRYCEAICNDILNSPYRQPVGKNQVKWTEPKRHFGLRDTKMKGVTWADPASCSSNTQYLKQHSETNGILMPSEISQQGRGILKCGKNSVENKPSNILTDEQRQYADDLISQYTSSVDYTKKKDDLQNTSDNMSDSNAGQQSDIVPERVNRERKCIVDDEKYVQEIIQKYAKECLNNDDQELTELISKVSFLADVKQDSHGHSDVRLVIKEPCVDEIVQKYVQQKCPETKSFN